VCVCAHLCVKEEGVEEEEEDRVKKKKKKKNAALDTGHLRSA
jgi:hypothetical protein